VKENVRGKLSRSRTTISACSKTPPPKKRTLGDSGKTWPRSSHPPPREKGGNAAKSVRGISLTTTGGEIRFILRGESKGGGLVRIGGVTREKKKEGTHGEDRHCAGSQQSVLEIQGVGKRKIVTGTGGVWGGGGGVGEKFKNNGTRVKEG